VDSTNKKRIETASDWAAKGNWQNHGSVKTVKTKEMPNGPFTDVRINGLEIRGEGGRAYKVIVAEDFYVDFRENELLWVIEHCGIRAGGIMNGEFIFAVDGSQTKLIPVGSPLHEELARLGERREKKPLGKKEFVAGHLYERKNGSRFVVLDIVKALSVHVKVTPDWDRSLRKNKYTISKVAGPSKRFLVWEDTYPSLDRTPKTALTDGALYMFSLMSNLSAIEDCGEYEDVASIDDVRASAKKAFGKKEGYRVGEYLELSSMCPVDQEFVKPSHVGNEGDFVW
jgi:hypothetical protein